jgi:hypothetical protein
MDKALFAIFANLSTLDTTYNYTQLTLGAPASTYLWTSIPQSI